MSPQLKGFCHPLSPEGKTSIIGAPPWYFSEDIMMINFKTNPELLKRYIPDPLEPPSDPGLGQVWLTNALSFSESERDLVFINPERTYYKECVVSIGVSYNGVQGLLISYIWVDNDFTLLRGWIQGFPKRLGRIYNSWERRQLYAINPALGEFGKGTKVSAWMETHGERMVEAAATLGNKITETELPAPCKMKYFNMVHFPSIEMGAKKPLVHQLCESDIKIRFGEIWEARNPTLKFFESPLEELAALQPETITGAYLVNIGIQVNGARVLHDNLKSNDR